MSGYRRATTLLGVARAVALAALVASCSPSKDAAEMNCPTMLPAPGADTIAVFHPGGQEPKDLLFAAQITSLNAECSRETPGVAIHAEIKFYAERANLLIPDGTLPYFVALLDADQHVLAEEAFDLKFAFLPAEYNRTLPAEKRTIHLPVHNRTDAKSFTVVVGFQLTPDQLAFNRARTANAP
jgi:hypothetical protein